MPSEVVVPEAEPRLHRLSTWFDPETAGVASILLGLFQVVLSVPLAYANESLPKLFILPLVLGILIVAGGSFTMASERSPSRYLLRGCAYSNVLSLLGTLLALCLYSYSMSSVSREPCISVFTDFYRPTHYQCPQEQLTGCFLSLTLLLLLYDAGAMVLNCLLSVSALKALKTN